MQRYPGDIDIIETLLEGNIFIQYNSWELISFSLENLDIVRLSNGMLFQQYIKSY